MYKKIYFIGIKGVGMATLAVIAKQAGFAVTGSDVFSEFITDEILKKEGIEVLIGFEPSNVQDFVNGVNASEVLVIVTAAHDGLNNIEATTARELGIKVITHGEAVGLFMSGDLFERSDLVGVSVSGAHGKTTIAAFLVSCLSLLSQDPSYTVGTSTIFPTGSAGHYGKGSYFVAEADEYLSDVKLDRNSKFLYQKPQFLIINNIDFDHPDFFKDITEIEKAFSLFVQNIRENGCLIVNGDDSRALSVSKTVRPDVRVVTYGVGEGNDIVISAYEQSEFSGRFTVSSRGMVLGRFEIGIPGFHNAKNALAVIAFLLEIGVSSAQIQQVLPQFKGTKRRIEIIGKTVSGAQIIDDYAHHPEEIKKTLSAIKQAYPSKKIVCVFQPHTYSRTQALLSEFVGAFMDADLLVFLPTFSSARNEQGNDTEQNILVTEEFRKMGKEIVMPEVKDVVEYLNKNFANDKYIIVTMGAGDVYKLGYKLKV